MPASDDRFFKHLINIPLILPDISSKTELQVSEDLLYESLDILRIKCLVLRNKVDLECHTLLSLWYNTKEHVCSENWQSDMTESLQR